MFVPFVVRFGLVPPVGLCRAPAALYAAVSAEAEIRAVILSQVRASNSLVLTSYALLHIPFHGGNVVLT